jgi:hypothetical protein
MYLIYVASASKGGKIASSIRCLTTLLHYAKEARYRCESLSQRSAGHLGLASSREGALHACIATKSW